MPALFGRPRGAAPPCFFVSLPANDFGLEGRNAMEDITEQLQRLQDKISRYGKENLEEILFSALEGISLVSGKELIRIYDKVLGKLSAMESRLLQFNPTLDDISSNYWQGEQFYYFSGETGTDTAGIDLVVLYSRSYTLNFTITVYPDDETIDPHLNLFFEAANPAKGTSNRTYFPNIRYLKDGQPHSYSIPLRIKEMPPIRIKGWFVNPENQYPGLKKHYFVENISLNPRLPGQ